MKLEELSIENIKCGYMHDPETGRYTCTVCKQAFEKGEVYAYQNRFFEASKAIEQHRDIEHADYLVQLLENPSKYNTLTEHQKQLFKLFAAGLSDKEIAAELGISASTVRHQKFMFREKAKQAKMYLAMYERVFERDVSGTSDIMPIHEHATMVDERYVITEKEKMYILRTAFTSLEPLVLKTFPPKEKKKVVILTKIAERFEKGKEYTEKEVNSVLLPVFEDYVTIRRYLIDYGFMKRTKDGAKYWLA